MERPSIRSPSSTPLSLLRQADPSSPRRQPASRRLLALSAIALGCAAVPAWAQDDDNHGDTTETATTIDPNSETAGELKSSDDVGYFRLDLDPFREGPFE